jgi:DNA-directed RNA polymerase specialized sigma24 family protein
VTDELVRQTQAGDHAAFRELYRQYAGRVYALCLRLTGDAADAEERTQDVFVRLWDKVGSFRGESAFTSWLHRLTVNVVLNERRTSGRRERRVAPVADPAVLERAGPGGGGGGRRPAGRGGGGRGGGGAPPAAAGPRHRSRAGDRRPA